MRKNIFNNKRYLLLYPLLSVINYYCIYAILYKLPNMMKIFNFGLTIILFVIFNILNIIISFYSLKILKLLHNSANSLIIILNVFFIVITALIIVLQILLSIIFSNMGEMWVN